MKLVIKWLVYSVSLTIVILVIILGAIWRVQTSYASHIVSESSLATSTAIGVVFGAGLNPNGTPREMLEARVMKGVELLEAGKVAKLFLTGGKQYGHNEPDAMKNYALGQGVPAERLIIDDGGSSTFESCRNTVQAFQHENTVLITQKFHLPRALYICNTLGLKSVGVVASSTNSVIESAYAKREYAASIKAWIEINMPFTRNYFEK